MNKNLIRLTIVAWVLVLILSTLAFVFFVVGRMWGGGFPFNAMGMPFHIMGQIGKNIRVDGVGNGIIGAGNSRRNFTGYTEEQDLSITQEISAIDLEWVSGKVKIMRSDNDGIRVVHTSNQNEDKKMMIKIENGSLSIADKFTSFLGNIPGSDVELYLPDKLYREIDIETVSADIESVYLQSKELDIESVSGNILLSCRADDASLQSISGFIRISEGQIVDLSASTVSGNLEVSGEVTRLSVESVSGTSRTILNNLPKELDMESVSGDIHLAMPDNNGFDLSTSGLKNFTSQFSITSRGNDQHRYKDGGPQLEVSTISGRFVLTMIGYKA